MKYLRKILSFLTKLLIAFLVIAGLFYLLIRWIIFDSKRKYDETLTLFVKYNNVECASEGTYFVVDSVNNQDFKFIIDRNVSLLADDDYFHSKTEKIIEEVGGNKIKVTGKLYKAFASNTYYECDVEAYKFQVNSIEDNTGKVLFTR